MTIYEENGYTSRRDYLTQLADEYGMELNTVFQFASILGPDEDFDGLVSSLQDYEFMN
jgi:hypothetical protein